MKPLFLKLSPELPIATEEELAPGRYDPVTQEYRESVVAPYGGCAPSARGLTRVRSTTSKFTHVSTLGGRDCAASGGQTDYSTDCLYRMYC